MLPVAMFTGFVVAVIATTVRQIRFHAKAHERAFLERLDRYGISTIQAAEMSKVGAAPANAKLYV